MCDGTGECLTQICENEHESLFMCPYNCQPIECPNYKLCKSKFPKWVGDCHQNRCTNCDIFWGNKDLVFLTATENCPVCLEFKEEHIQFPNCTHSVCISCFGELNFFSEEKYHLNPCLYGCPPCPNKCENPDKGIQCSCIDYDIIKEQWENEYPGQFNVYNIHEKQNIKNSAERNTNKCVLCRSIAPKPNWLRRL
jgi:hypothetical protein